MNNFRGHNSSTKRDIKGYDNIRPYSNSEMNSMGNFNDVYKGGIDGMTLMGKPDYTNPNYLLHNNVGEFTIKEQTFDHRIFIDSSIRCFTSHPNFFKFDVKFGGNDPTFENKELFYRGEKYNYNRRISGDTTIVIQQKPLKNVRYVNINSLIIPCHFNYNLLDDGKYEPECGCEIFKYIILKIKELSSSYKSSNSQSITPDSFLMKFDDSWGKNFQCWVPIYDSYVASSSNLKTINRLSFELCSDTGEILTLRKNGKPFDFYKEYTNMIDELDGKVRKEKYKMTDYEKNKIESLQKIIKISSPEIHLTVNIITPQIDTLPSF
jgi:hypothetical protein